MINRNSKTFRAFRRATQAACNSVDWIGDGASRAVFKAYDGVMIAGDAVSDFASNAVAGIKEGADIKNAKPIVGITWSRD